MDIRIINEKFNLSLYGLSGIAVNNNYTETGFRLMNEMWRQIKAHSLKSKGLNTWVYTGGNQLFVGVELSGVPKSDTGLDVKNIDLNKYAYYKHIGPYQQIKEAGAKVLLELKQRLLPVGDVYIEIYGHWVQDEALLETELIWKLI